MARLTATLLMLAACGLPLEVFADPAEPAPAESIGPLKITTTPSQGVTLDLIDPQGRHLTAKPPYDEAHAAAGVWRVKAHLDGYGDAEEAVEVSPNEETAIDFHLFPLGTLKVKATTDGAEVSVTGPGGFSHEGKLPWQSPPVRAGVYHLTVTHDRYPEAEFAVIVEPAKTAIAEVALDYRDAARVSKDLGYIRVLCLPASTVVLNGRYLALHTQTHPIDVVVPLGHYTVSCSGPQGLKSDPADCDVIQGSVCDYRKKVPVEPMLDPDTRE
jgi:hypothetical protein